MMKVTDIRLQSTDTTQELSATIDGFHLWYRFPAGYRISTRGDTFLAAALLPAMRAGETLVIEGAPVSRTLLRGIAKIQEIFHVWNPDFKIIDVHAETDEAELGNAGVSSFFSGGVDGTYTFLRHAEEISHLVFIKGVDIQIDNDALFDAALANNRRFADAYGKTLLAVETNIRRFCHPRGVPWGSTYCGSGLASVALALGFSRTYVASSMTFADLIPWGTHPLLDPLWSTEATTMVHDGAEARRSEKLREISRSRQALDILRVCWQDAGYNCGRCEKCVRTMVALRLLKLSSPNFPPLTSLEPLRRMRVVVDSDVMEFEDNLVLARQTGDHEVAAAIEKIIRRYRLRTLFVDLDTQLTAGRMKRAFRRLRPLRN
jgi:hypothetical protein